MKNLLILMTIVLSMIFTGCNNMKYNQTTEKSDMITKKYSNTQVKELKSNVTSKNISFIDFEKEFDAQCVRKTHQGYYVVLSLEDGGNAFAFFNDENTLVQVVISNRFKSRSEFQDYVVEQLPQSKVMDFDTNTFFLPMSAVEMTAHIVQEGICIVEYSRFANDTLLEDPIVVSVEFIENERIPTSENSFIKNSIPYILELDKVNGNEA